MKIFHFLDVGKVVMWLLQKRNDCALDIFNRNSNLPHLSAKKTFWKFLNTFADIAFPLGQGKGKIEIFHFSWCWKSGHVAIAKANDCSLEIFNHNSHLPHLSAKKTFLKIVKYFWSYSISAGTGEREKFKFLHILDVGKVGTLLLQIKISLHLKFSSTIATFLLFQRKKVF